ncbi:MAG: hypothetical protein LC749_11945 [Actinobacteria bacterium]|nr:hypothetical protein [Actinomycetota bacterium]
MADDATTQTGPKRPTRRDATPEDSAGDAAPEGGPDAATPLDRYRQVLMQRIREDRYPSLHLMDRVESCLNSKESTDDYANLLVDKMHETHYPSSDIMDRLQRLTCQEGPA